MNLSDEQLQVFKSSYLPDASDRELNLVRQVCKAKGLDPFANDIVFNRRSGKLVDVTTIDGARKRAARTGEYGGSDPAVIEQTEDGDTVCRITVYRFVHGNRVPFPAQRFLKETRGSGPVWSKSPKLMLEKCTEMTALRKAFPEMLGDTYADEEPFHTSDDRPGAAAALEDAPTNEERWVIVKQAFAAYGIPEADLLDEVKKPVAELNDNDFDHLTKWYEQCKAAK